MEPLGSFTNDSKINGQAGHLLTFFGTRSGDHISRSINYVGSLTPVDFTQAQFQTSP